MLFFQFACFCTIFLIDPVPSICGLFWACVRVCLRGRKNYGWKYVFRVVQPSFNWTNIFIRRILISWKKTTHFSPVIYISKMLPLPFETAILPLCTFEATRTLTIIKKSSTTRSRRYRNNELRFNAHTYFIGCDEQQRMNNKSNIPTHITWFYRSFHWT